jgi:hypothetical protein
MAVPWSRESKIAAAVGGIVLVGAGASVWYEAQHKKGTTGGGTTPQASAALGLGSPYVFEAGVRVRRRGLGVYDTAVGATALPNLTAQQGQHLAVPLSLQNNGPVQIWYSVSGYIWEGGSAASAPGVTLSTLGGIGQVVEGGHLTSAIGSSSPATGSVPAGGSATPELFSEGALGYTGFPYGVWVTAHIFLDSAMSQEMPGSPLDAWSSNAFLTVAPPSVSGTIGFGFGTPSVQ